MPHDELKPKDRVVLRMTRDGAVEENLTEGTSEKVSKRLEDAQLVALHDAETGDLTEEVRKRRQLRPDELEDAESQAQAETQSADAVQEYKPGDLPVSDDPTSYTLHSETYIRPTGDSWNRYFDGTLEDIPDEYRVTGSGEELEQPSTITVLVVEPDKKPYVKEIPSSLESLQHEVGGDIEAVYPFEEPVAIVCNGEGKMNGLPLNRALRDDNGEIYDIVAGTFLVTGLTDDSFGSLSPDLLRQFVTEFKMPEQFAKIGDRIVAIPMISEEQQKQTVLEEKSSIVNENTSGMAVDGHIGTWHTIDHKEIDGHTFWLMEHDTFGDDASCIIVDERGELVLSHIYDGFDETAVNLLRQEVMPVEKMPDGSISIEEMKQYGYKWGGMLPMREEAAAEVMKSCQIYRLYGDDTEGLVLDAKEIKEHAAKGGIFGVEKAEWVAELEKQNPLKAAEMSLEDDYGMIDGIINNGPKEDKASEKGGKASIMDRLKSAKTAQQTDKPSPHKEKKNEREI